MKPIHLLAGLSGTLAVALNLLLASRFTTPYDRAFGPFLGLAFGQLALLAFWCAAEAKVRCLPLATTGMVAAALSYPLGQMTALSGYYWFTFFGLFCLATAIAQIVAHGSIWRYHAGGETKEETGGRHASLQAGKGPLQFSLASLLGVVTLAALTMGMSRHVVLPTQAMTLAGYGIGLVVVAISTRLLAFSSHPTVIRLVGLLATCGIVGAMMRSLGEQPSSGFFVTIAFIEAVVTCAGLSVFEMSNDRDRRWVRP